MRLQSILLLGALLGLVIVRAVPLEDTANTGNVIELDYEPDYAEDDIVHEEEYNYYTGKSVEEEEEEANYETADANVTDVNEVSSPSDEVDDVIPDNEQVTDNQESNIVEADNDNEIADNVEESSPNDEVNNEIIVENNDNVVVEDAEDVENITDNVGGSSPNDEADNEIIVENNDNVVVEDPEDVNEEENDNQETIIVDDDDSAGTEEKDSSESESSESSEESSDSDESDEPFHRARPTKPLNFYRNQDKSQESSGRKSSWGYWGWKK